MTTTTTKRRGDGVFKMMFFVFNIGCIGAGLALAIIVFSASFGTGSTMHMFAHLPSSLTIGIMALMAAVYISASIFGCFSGFRVDVPFLLVIHTWILIPITLALHLFVVLRLCESAIASAESDAMVFWDKQVKNASLEEEFGCCLYGTRTDGDDDVVMGSVMVGQTSALFVEQAVMTRMMFCGLYVVECGMFVSSVLFYGRRRVRLCK
ncbi:hypothetical protein BC829DRAFT_390421 [Chytridium lagenaria]|nr:hypothetical protein BC829DRAFT_390421 [Chytridium lagenaria]